MRLERRGEAEGPRLSRRAVGQGVGAFLPGAVRAAIDDIALLDAMSHDPHPAMRAGRRKLLDRALEAVERVGLPAQAHQECLVIVVAALVALSHGHSPSGCENLSAIDRFRRVPQDPGPLARIAPGARLRLCVSRQP
ncbi:hypothetical protein MPL1032_60110 [Mesorhizobium plurifarium]|uniref:Uncharacterized protein n=1 Tax=Mesorhizobium plurifarium TaxID=69974 RepID=A0A0K2W6P5_MESPL|nr:hypothetical protein MPL1032_60110 [Mesorhizobium plurifarium]